MQHVSSGHLVMWHHWLKQHIMPTASIMAPPHVLHQDNWNEVQHDFFDHAMPLVQVSASQYADGSMNETIAFPRAMAPYISQSKTIKMGSNMNFLAMWCHWYWHQHHVMLITSSVKPTHSLGQDEQSEVQHDIFGHVTQLALAWASHNVNDIPNCTNHIS